MFGGRVNVFVGVAGRGRDGREVRPDTCHVELILWVGQCARDLALDARFGRLCQPYNLVK